MIENCFYKLVKEIKVITCFLVKYKRFEIKKAKMSNRPNRVAQLADHWASIPKVIGSIPSIIFNIKTNISHDTPILHC